MLYDNIMCFYFSKEKIIFYYFYILKNKQGLIFFFHFLIEIKKIQYY